MRRVLPPLPPRLTYKSNRQCTDLHRLATVFHIIWPSCRSLTCHAAFTPQPSLILPSRHFAESFHFRHVFMFVIQFPQFHRITQQPGLYRGPHKSLARPGRKQVRKHVRDARDFNNIETRAVFKFLSLQGKAPKEIHAFLTETLDCFLPGRAKDLSTPLYVNSCNVNREEVSLNYATRAKT